jgi:UDP-sugar transporter A1/2/3
MTNLLSAKNASLIALVFQQVGLVIIIRHSRMRKTDDNSLPYLTSTAVVSAECLKLILNLSLELLLVKREEGLSLSSIGTELASPESLKVAIPALLYVAQNNLLFVALSNLSVPLYQVTNQGKLLTTAVCSRLLLNKSISGMQYLSLLVLALGVAVVQLSSIEKVEASDNKNVEHGGQVIGLLAVVASCFTSGFAGVYFEKMLKSTQKVSVYMRNSQLAVWSILIGLIPVFLHDFDSIRKNGFFQGYDKIVVGVIVCQTMTGLVVALVMKYGDTILKGFATSVAVVLATVLSIFIWNAQVDGWFVVGAAMVMSAVALYSKYPPTTEDKDNHDGASHKSSGWSYTWLILLGLVLAVGNLIHSNMADYGKYMEFMEHPVEKAATILLTEEQKLDRILKAEQVTHYILSILQKRDVPVTFFAGTALHAFRDTSGSYFQANRLDDDIDMAVSRHHLISEFDQEMHFDLMINFGWGIRRGGGDQQIIQIVPGNEVALSVRKTPFQIDVYAFECDVVKGLVHFPWDNLYFDLKAFFPFERRDWILPPGSKFNGTTFFGLQFDQECMLENQYGADFRTPTHGKKMAKSEGSKLNATFIVGRPPCNRLMNEDQQRQFKRQLIMCEGCDASNANNQVLDDVANRSPVNSTVCIKKVR